MLDTTLLDSLYDNYSAGRLEKKAFEGKIYQAITEKNFRLPGFGKEDYEDFLSWLYPRISRTIDSYQRIGSSFESYISTVVRMSAREYRERQIHRCIAEAAAWSTQIPAWYALEAESGYFECLEINGTKEVTEAKRTRNSRQILILVLKCCRHISDDFLEKISRNIGMEVEVLRSMLDNLKKSREKREAKMEALQKFANHLLCRSLFHQKALVLAKDNLILAQKIKWRLARCQGRLAQARERLARLRADPSNAQIAELLGITKGAVDAALHSLKTRTKDRHT